RELLSAAGLARAFSSRMASRGDRVKGDNPVRRVCAAIARALDLAEPALYLAKGEPTVVAPVASEPPGLLVGLEVPKRHHSRQQRSPSCWPSARAASTAPKWPASPASP